VSETENRAEAIALEPKQQSVVRWLGYTLPLHKMPPKIGRWMFLFLDRLLGLKKESVDRVEDYVVNTRQGALPIRGYFPKINQANATKSAALLYFHGGGCVIGSIKTHDAFCRYLANQSGVAIFSVDYRLAPEHKYPAAIIDAIEAWNWLQQKAGSLGVDGKKLGVGGDSAGGYLSFIIGQKSLHSALPVATESTPCFQYLLYPMLDLVTLYPSYQQRAQGGLLTTDMMAYFGKHFLNSAEEKKELLASPLLIPEMQAIKSFVLSVEHDPLRDQALSLVNKLEQQNILVKHLHLSDCMHSFISVARVSPCAMQATEVIAKELKELTSR